MSGNNLASRLAATRVAMSPRFLESDASPSPACLEPSLSPNLTGQDSSPSPAGFESESSCYGSSPNPSPM